MNDAPKHIFAAPDRPGDWDSGVFHEFNEGFPEETRYRRADLPPTLAEALRVPEVAAIVAAYSDAVDNTFCACSYCLDVHEKGAAALAAIRSATDDPT